MQIKFLQTIFLFSGLLLLCFNLVQAQTWYSLNGPLESDVLDIIIKDDTVYVAASDAGGLFKRAVSSFQWYYSELSDGEGPFRRNIAGLLSLNVGYNGTYYAGGNGIFDQVSQVYGHFYISTNYGKTWTEFREGIESCGRVSDIFITHNNSTLIGCGKGIYKLIKEENRFEQVDDGWISRNSFFFNLKKDTLLAASEEGVEVSVNNGNTWTKVGPDTLGVYSISLANGTFYFGTDRGLYQTESLDQSWTFVEGLVPAPVNTLFTIQDMVIAGTDSGTYMLSSGDLEVQPVFPELDGQRVNVVNGFEGTLYVGSETGLYLCSITQNNCTLYGVPDSRIRAMSFHNDDTLIVSTSSKIQQYSTLTNQFNNLKIPVENARSLIPVNQDTLLTISSRYFLSCSFEYGACDSTLVVEPGNTLFNLTQNTAGDLFLISTSTVFQSKDQGSTWNPIFNFQTNKRNFRSPIFPVSDSLLFIDAAEQGLVKYSLNTGNYSIVGFEETGINAHYLASNGTIYVSDFYSIHKSPDLGETWKTLLYPDDVIGEDILINVLYDEATEKIYIIATEGRIYISDDEGNNWGVNDEMYPVYMESAAIGPDGTLYLGTQNAGVFTNTKPLNPPITISNEEEPNSTVPKSFILHQNYPNPFNPTTTVLFELRRAGEVVISLYNVFGQKVRDYNLGLKNAGSHQHKVDLQLQASGVYFLRVKAGHEIQTIKMTLAK